MEKILLNDGEELKLMLTMRNAVDYEKETGDHSISRLVTSFAQGQTPTLEEMNKVIYIAHKGVPTQKQYTLDEMIDVLPMDLSSILEIVYSLISQKAPKKGNSKKRLKE